MLVILESPYAGDIKRNLAYARRAVRDSVDLGESPIASHLLYTQPGILRDDVPAERDLGKALGYLWHDCADMMVVYHDFGITPGMRDAMFAWRKTGKPVAYRIIGQEENDAAL